jgi:hypothetical protein
MKGFSFLMKKTWVRKALSVGILAAGALLLAPAAMAQATVDQSNRAESITESGFLGGLGGIGGLFGTVSQLSFNDFSTIDGAQIALPVSMPVSGCGSSFALLGAGSSYGSCSGGGSFGYATQAVHAVQAVEVPVRQQFVRADNYSSCAYVVDSPCAAGAAGYGVVDGYDVGVVDSYDYGYDQVDYAAYDAAQYVEPVAIPVDTCGNSLGMYGYAGAYGSCGGGGADVVYTQSVQYVEPIIPVYTATPAYVLGGSDCVQVCGGGNAYVAGVQGQAYGHNAYPGVRGQGYRHKAPKRHRNIQGDVRGAQGYNDKGDVRGAQGYNDVQDDKAGYDQGSARDVEVPLVDDITGYDQGGARDAERFSATSFPRGLSGLGALDLLGGLR